MWIVLNFVVLFFIAILLETLAFVGIGELFNLIYKKSRLQEPLSLGRRLFTFYGESLKLARMLKNTSETLEPDFAAAMNRTPFSVIVTLFLVLLWCLTGIVTYTLKLNAAFAIAAMGAELIITVIAGRKLSGKNKSDDSTVKKCMKCKISKLSTYHTIRLRYKTFATVRTLNGTRYKMIPVANYVMRGQREKGIDTDMYCVVYYDYLPFAQCVIDPKELPRLRV